MVSKWPRSLNTVNVVCWELLNQQPVQVLILCELSGHDFVAFHSTFFFHIPYNHASYFLTWKALFFYEALSVSHTSNVLDPLCSCVQSQPLMLELSGRELFLQSSSVKSLTS